MRRLLLHIGFLFAGVPFGMSQGWVTSDATVVVKNDAHIVITTANGHYTSKGNSLVNTTNSGTVHVRGNWINIGTTQAIGNNAGTVILDGGLQQITGTTSTSFNNLELAGTDHKSITLQTLVGGGYTGTKNGALILNDKYLGLNTNLLIINNPQATSIKRSTGMIIGDTDPGIGYSKVQWTIRNTGPGLNYIVPFGTIDFQYIPQTIRISGGGTQVADSGYISIATYPTNTAAVPNNRPLPIGVTTLDNQYGIENDIKSVDRFYVIDAGGYQTYPDLSFDFTYLDRETAGTNLINEAELEATLFDAASNAWDYSLRRSTNAGTNTTRSSSKRNFIGSWTLHNPPYCPTAHFNFTNECLGLPLSIRDSSYITFGAIDTSVWEAENTSYPDQTALQHVFQSDGFFDVKRKVRGDRGCWDSVTRQVQVYPLPVSRFSHTDTCFTDVTQFASNSTSPLGMPLLHTWTMEGNTYNTEKSSHKFSTPGSQPIQLITENRLGCLDTLIRSIEIEPQPEVYFTFDNICERQEAFFYDSTETKGSIDEWRWTVKNRIVSYQRDHSQFFNVAGTYPIQLAARNNFGCSDSITRNIVIWPKPVAKFDVFPKEIYITEPYVNLVQSGSNANYWEWRLGDLSDDEYGPEVFHQYTDTGLFNIRLIARNDFGCGDTSFRTIVIKPDLRIWIPNAFSPGTSHEVNTYFRPGGMLYALKSMEMTIYTRWGEQIYHTEDINLPWDGTYKGKYVQAGTYLYLIKIKDVYNDVFHYSGTVNVIR